jgi:hypothetical protein
VKKALGIGCIVALVLGVLVVVIIGVGIYLLMKNPEVKKSYDEGFKTSYRESFVQSCTSGGTVTEKVCGCMADYMLANNTTSELTALGLKSQEEVVKSAVVQDAVKACVK